MKRVMIRNFKRHLIYSLGSAVQTAFVLPVFLCTIIVFCQSHVGYAHNVRHNVLLLNSYHVGYKWSDDIYKGILDSLGESVDPLAIHVEFMDTKRHYSRDRLEQLYQSMKTKYRDTPIDIIIASDDNAFLFLKKYAEVLFPVAQVVFCGTNYLDASELQGLDQFYGINEEAGIQATLELILQLHPQVEEIYLINDISVTGKKVDVHFSEAVKKYKDRVTIVKLDSLPMPRLLETVRSLPEKSVIFYTFFFRDVAGASYEYDESMILVEKASRVPIYGVWDFNLGYGLVGGKLTSGYYQGHGAGELALRLLRGDATENIPRLSDSPNRYIFDYVYLKKHNIPLSDLPASAEIINKPESFYGKHKSVLLSAFASMSILLIIILLLISNIIKRKRLERDLRQSENNFRGVFENAIEGLFQTTESGKFLRVNESLVKILKCDSREDVMSHYNDLGVELYAQKGQRAEILQQIEKTGQAQVELELFCKDRSKITVLLYCHRVLDESGNVLYLEGSITDMTEYKLTQEVIIQTEKMVSLGGLSAGIAHEINNPLNAIIQASQVVKNRLLSELPGNIESAEKNGITFKQLADYLNDREVPQLLENIADSGKRAHIIVEDMLSFSKKTIGEFSRHSLLEIVQEAVALLQKDYSLKRGYDFKSIQLEYSFDEEIPQVFCSGTKIRQVLFNILKNSAEAMEAGATPVPRISIQIHLIRNALQLEITDNGPGMEAKIRERIFEPFFTTKGGKKGTGLGLSVSYFIITENHKGSMGVESTPGSGTKFIIQLPLINPEKIDLSPLLQV